MSGLENDNSIDVFDCSQLEFWTKNEPLEPDDKDFKFQLQLEDVEDCDSFQSVGFSKNKKYAYVVCETKLMVYDLEGAGQSMVKTVRGQPIYPIHSKSLE